MRRPGRVLVDTNVIIEAVRTGCWAAVSGQLAVETVETCREESQAGSGANRPGYIAVDSGDLARLKEVHTVSTLERARFRLAYEHAASMDAGEHDLLAYAHAQQDVRWVLCSPDKASVRAAVTLGFGDQVCSLQDLVTLVGARADPPLRRQYTSEWLTSFRTKLLLGGA